MRATTKFAAAIAAVLAVPSVANAAVTVTVGQSGANVVATTTGTLLLTGLVADPGYSLSRGIVASFGYVASGATDGASVTGYTGLAGPGSFGPSSTYVSATSGTGISFAINGTGFGTPYVFVPTGFVSGGSLAGTATFAGQTLATLGLTSGTYVFRSNADTVTVIIGNAQSGVPEPATWAMLLAGFGALGFSLRRRPRVSGTVNFA